MSIKLEPVYLTNVLLYIDSLDTIKTFISVSKHCREASLILKKYSKLFEKGINPVRIEKEIVKQTTHEQPKNVFFEKSHFVKEFC